MKTIKKIKVSDMTSNKSYSAIPNQFTIRTPEGYYFQSYDTLIAFQDSKTRITYLDKDNWDYSVTTGKYRNQFLGEGIQETRQKIKSGEYKLVDLN